MSYEVVEYIDEYEGLHPDRSKISARVRLQKHLDVPDEDLSNLTRFHHVYFDLSDVVSISTEWWFWYAAVRLSTEIRTGKQWIILQNMSPQLKEALKLLGSENA